MLSDMKRMFRSITEGLFARNVKHDFESSAEKRRGIQDASLGSHGLHFTPATFRVNRYNLNLSMYTVNYI